MSLQKPTKNASVTFLPLDEGGRTMPAHNSASYRPHLVVGSIDQRAPITVNDGRTLLEEYLGVRFIGTGEVFLPGTSYHVTLLLEYHPEVDYSHLVPGATFTIREGGNIVGFGVVNSASVT